MGFNEDHPGVDIRKFGEDQSNTLTMGLFFPQNFQVVVITLCLRKIFPLIQLCKYTYQQNCAQPISSSFLYFFLSPVGPSIWDEIAKNKFSIILRGLYSLCPYDECSVKMSFREGWLEVAFVSIRRMSTFLVNNKTSEM